MKININQLEYLVEGNIPLTATDDSLSESNSPRNVGRKKMLNRFLKLSEVDSKLEDIHVLE